MAVIAKAALAKYLKGKTITEARWREVDKKDTLHLTFVGGSALELRVKTANTEASADNPLMGTAVMIVGVC